MTAEERAQKAWLGMTGPVSLEAFLASLASAIRAAEDEALERAALRIEGDDRIGCAAECIEAIRSLKSSKDGGR